MQNIIETLHGKGIKFWVSEGKLHYRAPKDVLTPAILDELKANKDEIIKSLTQPIIEEDTNRFDKKAIEAICEASWIRETKDLNRTLLKKWIDLAEEVALQEMYQLFLESGIFCSSKLTYTYEEMISKLQMSEKYQHFLRRWLRIFEKEDFIRKVNGGYQSLLQEVPKRNQLWENYWKVEQEFQYGEGFVRYLQTCSKNLRNLFCGSVTPLELLFPQGKMDVAVDTYQNTKSSQILNHMAADAIVAAYENRKGKEVFRILEVGAGVGGTSDGVIDRIDGLNVEYHYTDVSNYFLRNAQERYRGKDWIQYELLDVNDGHLEEHDAKFDLILCANVLHNAKDGVKVLSMLKSRLNQEGIMVIIDAVKEPYYLLTSIEFNDGLRDFDDFRKEEDGTFFERDQWEYMFAKTGGTILAEFPTKEDVFYRLGQGIFVVSFENKCEKRVLHTSSSKAKVTDISPKSVNSPKTPLEKEIASIWCEVLQRDSVSIDENFFLIGGDSLLLSQVISLMWETISDTKEWDWGVLMKMMMTYPTIASLAENILKKNQGGSLLTNLIDQKDSEIVYVLFHAGTGTLTPYADLVEELKNRKFPHRLLGISCQNMKEYLEQSTSNMYQTLAKKYYGELASLKGKKIHFIGQCIGGIIALETAKCMQENGISIDTVTMISTNICEQKFPESYVQVFHNDLIMEKVFGRLIGSDLHKAGYTIDDIEIKKMIEQMLESNKGTLETEKLGETFQKLGLKSHEERLQHLYLLSNSNSEGVSTEYMEYIYQVFKKNFLASLSYQPSTYPGAVRILKCGCETKNFFINTFDNFTESEKAWGCNLPGSISVEDIEGDHISCMERPYIRKNLYSIIGDFEYE